MELADLVRAAQRGERAATTELYARFHRAVHAVVLAHARYADAADLVQDVFVAALRSLSDVQDADAFPGWLMSIARNTAIDHLRKRARQANQNHKLAAIKPAATVEENSSPSADANRVLQALQTLPDAYRETLIMRLLEDMTGPEIAERTGLAPGSVRVNLHRGMELLRAALTPRAEAV